MYTASLAIDNSILAPLAISLPAELTARELIEAAFIQLQTDAAPDPFKLTLTYYGYDHFQGVTTYLGYFIVSINQYVSDASHYWDLFVNGQTSPVGIDSYLVRANDQVQLKWITVPPPTPRSTERVHRVNARRGI
jgi:Domain of unknown function (DUF4430)